MKVLHINGNYIYSNLHQLMCNKLNALDVDNIVFVPTYTGAKANIAVKEDVIVSDCFDKNDRFFFYQKQKKIINSLQEKIDMNSIDIIHAYTLFTDGNSAYELSKEYNIPYVVAIRNTDINHFFKKRKLLKKRGIEIALNAERLFFLSESYKKWILENIIPERFREKIEKKSVIIPNGIDDFWFENAQHKTHALDKKCINLIYAGSIDRNKNITKTQEAIELLSNQYSIRFTVVGPIRDDEEHKIVAANKYTTYVEKQPKEELVHYYRKNNIFVMPSITETFGLVYAEAMSQGLPIIYTQGQGFDGQFEEGFVGYHVNAKSANDIANKIEMVINDYDRIAGNTIGAIEKFRWDSICKQYKTIYEELLER